MKDRMSIGETVQLKEHYASVWMLQVLQAHPIAILFRPSGVTLCMVIKCSGVFMGGASVVVLLVHRNSHGLVDVTATRTQDVILLVSAD